MTTNIMETRPTQQEVDLQEVAVNYHTAGSVPAATLNALIGDLYRIYRNNFFKGAIRIEDPVLLDLDYDVLTAPRISFAATNDDVMTAFREETEAALGNGELPVPVDIESALRDIAGPVTFTGDMDAVVVGYKFDDEPRKEVKVGVRISGIPEIAMVGPRRIIRPRIVAIRVSGPDPETEKFINAYVAPLLVPVINQLIVKHWSLPELGFLGVTFSPPELRSFDNVLLVYAAMERSGPTVAPAQPRPIGPSDRMTLALDAALANTVAKNVIDPLHFSLGPIEFNILTLYCRFASSFGLTNPRLQFFPNNVATGDLTGYGNGSATFQLRPFPPVTPTVSVAATPRVVTSLFVQDGAVGFFTILLRELIEVTFHFNGLPWWLNDLIGKVIGFLATAIVQPIAAFISLLRIPLFRIPQQQLSFGGIKATIRFDRVGVDTVQADGKVLGVAHGVAVALS